MDFPILSYAAAKQPMQTIGRNPASTLCLTDNMTVSNRHVSLEQHLSKEGRRSVVLHESSSNGTWVNGVQYHKGSSLELRSGAEVSFPCEDTMSVDRKKDFTFVFQVLGESLDKPHEPHEPATEWIKLQEQCDELSKEAARLAASVYSNNGQLQSLNTLLISQPRDDITEHKAFEMLQALKQAEARLRTLGDQDTADCLASHPWEQVLKSRRSHAS